MKKIFSLFAAVLFAGSMMAEESVVYTLDGTVTGGTNAYAEASNINQDDVDWSVTGNTTMSPWRIGGKNLTNEDRPIFSKTAIADNVSKIELEHGSASSITVNSITVIVASDAAFTNVISTLTPTFAASSTATVERPAGKDWSNAYYKFVYNVTVTSTSSNKFMEFKGAKFYAEQGAGPAVAKPVIEGDAEFEDATEVSIICETESAKIYYTIDGKEPSATSTEYTIPFVINQTTTVKAIAILEEDKSAVVTKVFTKVEPAQPITCADIYQMNKDDKIDLLNDVVVTFANGKNVWVRDASASMLIYLPAEGSFNSGEVLSGVTGKVDIYNGIYEISMTSTQVNAITVTPGEAPAAIEVATVETADMNKYIVMKGVEAEGTFEEGAQSNLTINGIAVRNQFKNGYTFTAGTKYDIYGVVTIYKNAPQIYFISAEVSAPTALDNTAIENKAMKTIKNGMIIIEKAGVRYNVLGQIVR